MWTGRADVDGAASEAVRDGAQASGLRHCGMSVPWMQFRKPKMPKFWRTTRHFDMSSEKEEACEEVLLTAEISKCLRRHCGDGGDMFDFAVESILADVQEDGVPKDVDEALCRWSSTLEDCELKPFDEDDEDEDTSELVLNMYGDLIEGIQGAMAEAKGDIVEYLSSDQCEMCERVTPLTRHHLWPTSEHDFFKKRNLCQPDRSLHEVAAVCRPCHTAIHAFADERTLGESYNTIESLLEVEQLRKFAHYMSKQKGGMKKHDNALRYAK